MATASFATYLQKPRELPVPEFRAPPPSPVTGVLTSSSSGSSEHGECPDEEDEIGRFLRRSARVPVLRLPERAVPRKEKKAAWAPPVIDMRLLGPGEAGGPVEEALRSAAVGFGCFQVVGHGVNRNLVLEALRLAPARSRSPAPEMEASGEGGEGDEELWWSPGEGDQETAGNWPLQNGARQLRNKADDLFTQLEQTATKIVDALQRPGGVGATESLATGADRNGSLLCIRTHHRKQRDSSSISGPISDDDILRMLIRNSRCSRALALHLCPGASAFHIFSRRGWSRFRSLDGAIVVTVGDQLQAWSCGLYTRAWLGNRLTPYSDDDLRGDGGDDVDAVSAEFLHSRSSAGMANEPADDADVGKIIPLNLQIIVAACLVLAYHFLLPCVYAMW